MDEKKRLEALWRYDVLDTPPDGSFDNIVTLAASLLNTPVALVTLVDEDRIWFKSKHGLDAQQIDKEPGLCASVVLSDEAYVVEHASKDKRTLANSLVNKKDGVEFYAASPLITSDGYSLGTLCVIDTKPRTISEKEIQILQNLAQVVMDMMEVSLQARLALRKEMEVVHILTHDLKGYLCNLPAFTKMLKDDEMSKEEFDNCLHVIKSGAEKHYKSILAFLDSASQTYNDQNYSKTDCIIPEIFKSVTQINKILADNKGQNLQIDVDPSVESLILEVDKYKMKDAFHHLINNAIKYSPLRSTIQVKLKIDGNKLCFQVSDEGPGFTQEEKDKLFKRFGVLNHQPTGNETATGVGLWTVKQIITHHGGEVSAESLGPGEGANFGFQIPLEINE